MKKHFFSFFALMMLCISASAQFEAGQDYFFKNVSTGYWMAGGNWWGTNVSLLGIPQSFMAEATNAEGVYKLDSHQYNSATDHYLNTGYLDNAGCTWTLEDAGNGYWYLKSSEGTYATAGEKNASLLFSSETSAASKWEVYTIADVIERMKNAPEGETVSVPELVKNGSIKRNANTSYYPTWTITAFDGTSKVNNFNQGQDGNIVNCAESYHSTNGFKAVQSVDNSWLVPGLYTLNAQAFYSGTDTELPYFALNDAKSTFPKIAYGESNMVGSYQSFLEGKYPINPVYVSLSQDDLDNEKGLTITIAGASTVLWNIFGEITLSYTKPSIDVYQAMMDTYLQGLTNYADYNDESNFLSASFYDEWAKAVGTADYEALLDEGNYFNSCPSYITAYSLEEYEANVAAIQEIETRIKANMTAWSDLKTTKTEAQGIMADESSYNTSSPSMTALANYVNNDVTSAINAHELTTDEINAMKTTLSEKISDARYNSAKDGADMTALLVNPTMDSADGWEGSPAINNFCGEKYGVGAFDVYQVVKNAPLGVYEIEVQGFYRQERNDDSNLTSWHLYFNEDDTYRSWKDPQPDPLGYVYMNDAMTPLKSVYYEPNEAIYTDNNKTTLNMTGGWNVDGGKMYAYPNDAQSAAVCFNKNEYKVSAYGIVAKEGDEMRIGVKGDLLNGANWCIFDNFKLIYRAYNAEVVKSALEAALAEMPSIDGIYGSDVKTAVEAARTAANTAIADNDGEEMFNALTDVYAASSKVSDSKTLFATLTTQTNELSSVLNNTKESAAPVVYLTASDFYKKCSAVLEGSETFTDAQATEAIETIAEVIRELGIVNPEGNEPSDETPLGYTSYIKNADYAASTGWTLASTSGNLSVNTDAKAAEMYQGVKSDIYQDVVALPAGTYKLGAQAFYRAGSTAEDYQSVLKSEESGAYIYAIAYNNNFAKADIIKVPVTHITKQAQESALSDGDTGVAPFSEEYDNTLWYTANTMAAFRVYADNEMYTNEMIIKVAEGDTVRIGIAKDNDATISMDWAIVSDWTLEYYGAASTKTVGSLNPADYSYSDYTFYMNTELAAARKPLSEIIEFAKTVSLEDEAEQEALTQSISDAETVYNAQSSVSEVNDAYKALSDTLEGYGIQFVSTAVSAPTADVKSVKDGTYLMNGKVVIIKNDKMFSTTGAQMK